jgi:hypothetical protein
MTLRFFLLAKVQIITNTPSNDGVKVTKKGQIGAKNPKIWQESLFFAVLRGVFRNMYYLCKAKTNQMMTMDRILRRNGMTHNMLLLLMLALAMGTQAAERMKLNFNADWR